MSRRILLAVLAALTLSLFAAANSWAAGASSLELGPTAVPNVPLRVCVGTACEVSPAVSSVSMSLSADTALPNGTPAALVRMPCSSGPGVAAQVTAGSSPTTVTGSLTLIVDDRPVVLPVKRTLPANAPASMIAACAAG